MSQIETRYQRTYGCKGISRNDFQSLVEKLDTFKASLQTTERLIESEAISHDNITKQQGNLSWNVLETHPLDKLQKVQTELTLVQRTGVSCQAHIEFTPGRVFISVSDIGSSWGKPVYDDVCKLVEDDKLIHKAYIERSYFILSHLQNVLMILGATLFLLWNSGKSHSYLYASIAFFLSGFIPVIQNLFRQFIPKAATPIIQEKRPFTFPYIEATSVLGFLTGLVNFIYALIKLFCNGT